MKALFFIRCNFMTDQYSKTVEGFAICSDPDTPVTFVYPDGTAYKGEDIWNYSLIHHAPWSSLIAP